MSAPFNFSSECRTRIKKERIPIFKFIKDQKLMKNLELTINNKKLTNFNKVFEIKKKNNLNKSVDFNKKKFEKRKIKNTYFTIKKCSKLSHLLNTNKNEDFNINDLENKIFKKKKKIRNSKFFVKPIFKKINNKVIFINKNDFDYVKSANNRYLDIINKIKNK